MFFFLIVNSYCFFSAEFTNCAIKHLFLFSFYKIRYSEEKIMNYLEILPFLICNNLYPFQDYGRCFLVYFENIKKGSHEL